MLFSWPGLCGQWTDLYWPLNNGDQKSFLYEWTKQLNTGVVIWNTNQFQVNLGTGHHSADYEVHEVTTNGIFLVQTVSSSTSRSFNPKVLLMNDTLLQQGGVKITETSVSQSGVSNYSATYTVAITKAGTVKVPAGTFSDCRNIIVTLRETIPGYGTQTTNALTAVLAPHVGIIRKLIKAGTSKKPAVWADLLSGTVSNVPILDWSSTRLLVVQTNGFGTTTPDYSREGLQLGKGYSITAKPAVGWVFSNWVNNADLVLTNGATLKFTMQTNLVLKANFTPNPFIPMKGNYAGLFADTNGVTPTNVGLFTATLTDQGSFSAKLQQAGTSYSIASQFPVGGVFSTTIVRRGQSPLSVYLQLGLAGTDVITGFISDGAWTAELTANRAVYSKTNPAPQAGRKFTVMLLGSEDSQTQPGGYSFGTVSVDALGNLAFSGSLGDGSKVVQTTFLSKHGDWPFYLPLYSGKGVALGWLQFTNQTDTDITGVVKWIKLPQPGKFYPNGFVCTNGLEVSGSLYSFTNGLRLLNWTNGETVLADGNLPQSITNQVVLDVNNKVTGSNKLSLTITASGLFQGTMTDPATRKVITMNGVVLQKQNAGVGSFLGTNQSGSVWLGAK